MQAKSKDSLWYWLFRSYLKRCLEFFYRRIEVQGQENIPKDKPVIFASNHVNALMDPLVIAYFSGKQQYFMTRGDVFTIPWVAAIFKSWRMLPIFRMKDGIDSLAKNDAIMDFVVERLKTGYSIIIFPEASHFWVPTVQPLKKGLARLAFEVLSQNPDSELHVVPVGLHYSDKIKVNQDVLVSFGKAISIRDFQQDPNLQRTYGAFNKELYQRMRKLVLCIDDKNNLKKLDFLRLELSKGLKHIAYTKVLPLEQDYINALQTAIKQNEIVLHNETTLEETLNLASLEAVNKIYQSYFPQKRESRFLAWIKFPFYALALFNFIPSLLLLKLLLEKMKDRTFHSSVKYGFGLIVLPFIAVLQALLVCIISGNLWHALVYLLLFPVFAGLLAEYLGRKNYSFDYDAILGLDSPD